MSVLDFHGSLLRVMTTHHSEKRCITATGHRGIDDGELWCGKVGEIVTKQDDSNSRDESPKKYGPVGISTSQLVEQQRS